jgi:hypothetical protein
VLFYTSSYDYAPTPKHHRKNKKTKWQTPCTALRLEERSPWCLPFCFFLFSRGFGQSPKNAKTIEKQKNKMADTMHKFKTGGEVHGVCPFVFFLMVSSRFWPASQKCKRFLQWDMGEEQLSSKWFPDKPFQYQFLLLSVITIIV